MKDDYTLVCRLLAGGLIVLSIGWLLDHGPALRQAWKDYRQRAADLRRVKMAPPATSWDAAKLKYLAHDLADHYGVTITDASDTLRQAMTVDAEAISTALTGVFLVPPGTLNVGDRVVFSTQPLLKREAPAGTVQNPSDPSPTPHVQRFGSKFPR